MKSIQSVLSAVRGNSATSRSKPSHQFDSSSRPSGFGKLLWPQVKGVVNDNFTSAGRRGFSILCYEIQKYE